MKYKNNSKKRTKKIINCEELKNQFSNIFEIDCNEINENNRYKMNLSVILNRSMS